MRVKSAAKVNLALDVTGRLGNGYHLIESVFQTVGIYDDITVTLNSGGINITCTLPEQFAQSDPIPCDERNIAYKAAKLFFESTGYNGGCDIIIEKGIPSQAGMGGGSTDAAAVLYCLDQLTGAALSAGELVGLGKQLGADVPFFFTGGTAYVGGIGDEITPSVDYSGRILVIAKGTEGVSTAEAYRAIDALVSPVHPETGRLVEALEKAPDEAYRFFGNLFEAAIQLDEVDKLRSAMLNKNALKANMTGSGSAVFGLFATEEQAEICAADLRSQGYFAQICCTVERSFELMPDQT